MFCKHCGIEIDADSSFCPKCGKLVSSGKMAVAEGRFMKETNEEQEGMHCPHCGYENLQVIVETNTQTSGKNFSVGQGCLGYLLLGPLGILCGTCGQGQHTTTTNATYWICPKCGKKFRDIEEQRQSIKNLVIFKYSWPLFCLAMIPVFCCSAGVFGGDKEEVLLSFLIALLIFGAMGIAGYVGTVNAIEKSEEAIDELEDAIYNTEKDEGNVWKCSQCGRTNQNYTGTCACGQRKP